MSIPRFSAVLFLVVTAACSSVSIPKRPATPEEAAMGDQMAGKLVDALGGMEAYQRLRIISFDFVIEGAGMSKNRAHHDWDPRRNIARVVTGDDEVILDCATQRGRLFVDGKEVTDQAKVAEAVKDAYRAWVNDTYWLVSPFKLFDPGARRAWIDGKLRISFEEKIGLTPGDVYQYTLADDGKPLSWAFHLQSGLRLSADFKEPVTHDGVTLYAYKPAGIAAIRLKNLDFSTTPRPELFRGM